MNTAWYAEVWRIWYMFHTPMLYKQLKRSLVKFSGTIYYSNIVDFCGVWVHMCMHVCMWAHMCVGVCVCTYLSVCVRVCVCVCVNVY